MSAETVDTPAGAAPPERAGAPDTPLPSRLRIRAALRRATPALALFATIRLAGLVSTALWAWHTGRHPRTLLGASWDSRWYLSIARHGYGAPAPTGMWPDLPFADLAFFPLYPWLARIVGSLIPVGLLNAALLVAWAASALAAWGVFAVGAHLYDRRVGTLLVVLWALLPHGIIESLAYTESLLTALCAWSLYALLTRRFLAAAALAVLAGLARPSALAIVAAVGAVAVTHTWHRPGPLPLRLWAAALLAPLGWLGYVLWVGARAGIGPLGYFEVQELWGSRFDFGHDTLRSVKHLVLYGDPPAHFMVVAVLSVSLLLYALLVLDRPPTALLVYTTVLVVIALGGTGYFASKPRFLLPAFPLLLPLALALSRARTRTLLLTTGSLGSLALGYGIYLLTVADLPL